VIARRVPDTGNISVDPGHFLIEPISPLFPQLSSIGGQPDDLIASEDDKIGCAGEALYDRVDTSERPLVRRIGHARACITIKDELVTGATRQQ
jgi:hypothetical protein